MIKMSQHEQIGQHDQMIKMSWQKSKWSKWPKWVNLSQHEQIGQHDQNDQNEPTKVKMNHNEKKEST